MGRRILVKHLGDPKAGDSGEITQFATEFNETLRFAEDFWS